MKPGGGGGRELSAWVRKGPWTAEEDEVLRRHVLENGPREWSSIRSKGLLPRTGKSCRLRWVNKLRPDIKKGCKFSAEEERVVIELQAQFGNKWARIATYLSGRTDNDVKNFWSTRQKRLARLQRAPAGPRRRPGGASSGRQSGGGASSSHARASPAQKLQLLCQSPFQDMDMDMDMIPFQETKPSLIHTRGQSGSGRQSCSGASSSRACESPAQMLLCQSPWQDMDMIPFQETKPPLIHTGGQSSIRQDAQEPPRPRTVQALAITLPTHYDSASELRSSSATPTAAATRLLSFGDGDGNTRSPPSGVDPLVFTDPFDDDAFSPEPPEVVPPTPFFGLDVEEYVHFRPAMHQGVRFDDLTPETLDFFGLPPSAQP